VLKIETINDFLKRIKYKIQSILNKNTQEYKDYTRALSNINDDIERCKKNIQGKNGKPHQWEYNLEKALLAKRFMRPNSIKDIYERDLFYNKFQEAFLDVRPDRNRFVFPWNTNLFCKKNIKKWCNISNS
jgi:hypothetical protein